MEGRGGCEDGGEEVEGEGNMTLMLAASLTSSCQPSVTFSVFNLV